MHCFTGGYEEYDDEDENDDGASTTRSFQTCASDEEEDDSTDFLDISTPEDSIQGMIIHLIPYIFDILSLLNKIFDWRQKYLTQNGLENLKVLRNGEPRIPFIKES